MAPSNAHPYSKAKSIAAAIALPPQSLRFDDEEVDAELVQRMVKEVFVVMPSTGLIQALQSSQ